MRTPRRLLLLTFVASIGVAGWLAAGRASTPPRVAAAYDEETGRLRLITYDANGNGRVDTWSHMDGSRALWAEIDADENGVPERWEYFDASGRIEKVGYSRAGGAEPDAWAWPDASGQVAKRAFAGRAAGVMARTEEYDGGRLLRVTEDADEDGRPDRWEAYAGGRLASLALDLSRRGSPDRRLVYGPTGEIERIEQDADGDGRFEPAAVRGTAGGDGEGAPAAAGVRGGTPRDSGRHGG